jgi:hypothetical protein
MKSRSSASCVRRKRVWHRYRKLRGELTSMPLPVSSTRGAAQKWGVVATLADDLTFAIGYPLLSSLIATRTVGRLCRIRAQSHAQTIPSVA